jgi:hypothetical protein
MKRTSDFNYMSKPTASFKIGMPRGVNEYLGNLHPSTAGGEYLGRALGGTLGSTSGFISGASYNPTIVDEKTGKKRKLNTVERLGAIGGGTLGGNLLGKAAGSGLGALGGLASKENPFVYGAGVPIQVARRYNSGSNFNASVSNIGRYGQIGSLAGDVVGSVAGGLAGANYNPDIIDNEAPGGKRKLGLLGRGTAVLGGASLGGLTGKVVGGAAGRAAGLASNKRRGVKVNGRNVDVIVNYSSNTKEYANFVSNAMLGAVAGSGPGSALGSVGGLLAGATYNPDIIDPETGEKRKIGLLGRTGLVVGGYLGGAAAGSALGAAGGALGGSMMGRMRPNTVV